MNEILAYMTAVISRPPKLRFLYKVLLFYILWQLKNGWWCIYRLVACPGDSTVMAITTFVVNDIRQQRNVIEAERAMNALPRPLPNRYPTAALLPAGKENSRKEKIPTAEPFLFVPFGQVAQFFFLPLKWSHGCF